MKIGPIRKAIVIHGQQACSAGSITPPPAKRGAWRRRSLAPLLALMIWYYEKNFGNIPPAMKKLLAVALLVLSGQAQAHDLWLEREEEGLGLHYGHKHSGHEGVEYREYKPEWVREARCFDATGSEVAFRSPPTYPFRIPRQCAAACVLTSSGYWTKTPYGTENLPKAEARMPIKSWLSFESVKRIDRWSAELAEPLTAWLEMTPLGDPASLRKGEKLRLRVSFEGRPMAGVVVSYDGKPRGTSGRDGEINIRLRHGGFQVIQASLTLPDASGKADEVIHSANLNFELPKE